jgi:hypothetical protein
LSYGEPWPWKQTVERNIMQTRMLHIFWSWFCVSSRNLSLARRGDDQNH